MGATLGTMMIERSVGVDLQPAVPAPPVVVQISRGRRTIGLVLLDEHGARWQRTSDVDRLVTVATVTAGAATVAGVLAAAVRRPRVQRITMGPGGWVSFRGAGSPRLRGPRPWWAHLLRAWPLDG